MKHLPEVEYTEDDERSDTAWLCGVSYGREVERKAMLAEGYVLKDSSKS